MMCQSVTLDDLVASYIQRFHSDKTILVIHKNNSRGYVSVLQHLEDDLLMRVPNIIEINSDYIFVGAYTNDAKTFLENNKRDKCQTRIDLYIKGVLYACN